MFGRSSAPDEVQLVAELEQSRAELMRVEGEAAAAVGRARAAVTASQAALDTYRLGQVRENAAAWRQEAVRLRERASEAGDQTTVVTIHVLGGVNGHSTEPKLVFTANLLNDQAAAADQRAQHLENRLQVGDLAGEPLALLVSQLEELPEPEPVAV